MSDWIELNQMDIQIFVYYYYKTTKFSQHAQYAMHLNLNKHVSFAASKIFIRFFFFFCSFWSHQNKFLYIELLLIFSTLYFSPIILIVHLGKIILSNCFFNFLTSQLLLSFLNIWLYLLLENHSSDFFSFLTAMVISLLLSNSLHFSILTLPFSLDASYIMAFLKSVLMGSFSPFFISQRIFLSSYTFHSCHPIHLIIPYTPISDGI